MQSDLSRAKAERPTLKDSIEYGHFIADDFFVAIDLDAWVFLRPETHALKVVSAKFHLREQTVLE